MFVHQMLERCNDDSVAFRYNDQTITYGEFKRNTKAYRDYFYTEGIRPGDNVGLFAKNSPEFIYSYFGVVSMGAVVVPLNISFTPREIEYIAMDAGMKHLISYEGLNVDRKYKQLVIQDFSSRLSNMDLQESVVMTEGDEDQVCVIIYTSGTTGNPKGALLTHLNLISNVESTSDAFEYSDSDVVLCVLPMFHSFAWTVAVLSAIDKTATIVIMETFSPKDAIRLITDEKITLVIGVPAMFNYYLSKGSKEAYQSVRLFISGGASLPVEITDSFRKKYGHAIVEGYGLSEASPVVSVNPLDDVRVGSIGKPIRDVEVKILDEDGHTLGNGEIGELLVKGPNVMKGYYNLPEVTEKTIVHGWLHTGDMARIDGEGYIYIVDRLKDIIIVGGMNVYPREIEELFYRHDGIVEAAVIGVPDETRGESVVAYIVVEDRDNFDLKELKMLLRENLAAFKLPRKYIFMQALPKNATGKIMKKMLREEFRGQADG